MAFDGTSNIELPLSSNYCKVSAGFPTDKSKATQTSLTIPSGYKYYFLIFDIFHWGWTTIRRHLTTDVYNVTDGITGIDLTPVNDFSIGYPISTNKAGCFPLKAYDEEDRTVFTGALLLNVQNTNNKLLFEAGLMSTAPDAVCNNTPILVCTSLGNPQDIRNVNARVTAVFFN